MAQAQLERRSAEREGKGTKTWTMPLGVYFWKRAMHFLFVSIPRFLVGKYKITTVVGTMTKINCLSNLPWFWIYLGIIN